MLQIDFWSVAVQGAIESGEWWEFLISGALWSIFIALVLTFKYSLNPIIAIPVAPVVVGLGSVLLFGGFIVLIQAMIALLVPALVLFFLFTVLPISIGYGD